MTVSIWQTANVAEQAPERVDVVVIGAGIIGAYLTMRLRSQGRDVTVVEGRHIASGASGRNGGLLITGVAHSYMAACARYGPTVARDLWALTIQNREEMIGWATRLHTPVRRCGSLLLACTVEQAEEIQESAAMMHAVGIAATWHAYDPLKRGFLAAIENRDDGAANSALLTAALLKHSGAEVREMAEVYALESLDDGVLVRTRSGNLLAQQVFLATNAWTPLLVDEFRDVIIPGRGQVIATVPAPILLHEAGYCDDGFEYFQQLPDGRFILGGYRYLRLEEETTYADNTTPAIQHALEAFIDQYFPELSSVPIERRWTGTMAFTSDGLPLVGRLRRDERIAFAVAFNGHGLGLGIKVVDALLDELQGGTQSMFSARRLMKGVA